MYQLSVSSVQVVYQEIIFTDQDSQQWDRLLTGGAVSIRGVFQDLITKQPDQTSSMTL